MITIMKKNPSQKCFAIRMMHDALYLHILVIINFQVIISQYIVIILSDLKKNVHRTIDNGRHVCNI